MRVKIRRGAKVCQDHGVKIWPIVPGEHDVQFDIDPKQTSPGILTLRAFGYGSLGPGYGAYGNGALFVNEVDIVKDGVKLDLAKRFELLAERVKNLSTILIRPEVSLESWVDQVSRALDELDELAVDVIRHEKGGPA